MALKGNKCTPAGKSQGLRLLGWQREAAEDIEKGEGTLRMLAKWEH